MKDNEHRVCKGCKNATGAGFCGCADDEEDSLNTEQKKQNLKRILDKLKEEEGLEMPFGIR